MKNFRMYYIGVRDGKKGEIRGLNREKNERCFLAPGLSDHCGEKEK